MTIKYVISSNREDWSEECYDSRDEVIQVGIGEFMGDHFWIGIACPPDFCVVESKEKIEPRDL